MGKATSTPTRVSHDVAAAAAAVAPGEHRTFAEQVNYWARIGMQLERSATNVTREVLAAAEGRAQFSTLDEPQRRAAHAMVDAGIAERASKDRFGAAARATGRVTVSVDDDGNVVEVHPGGERKRL